MFEINNFLNRLTGNSDNANIGVVDWQGVFSVIDYQRDASVTFSTAEDEYFAARMGVRRRQLACDLSKSSVTLQSGAMQ